MVQIEKTMALQAENESCTVRIMKYLIVDNNLYIVMQYCQQSIRALLRSQRILAQDRSENGSFGAGDTYSQGSFIEPWRMTRSRGSSVTMSCLPLLYK